MIGGRDDGGGGSGGRLRAAGRLALGLGALTCTLGAWMEATRSPAAHMAEAERALSAGRAGAAEAAVRAAISADPGRADGYHLLAYARTLRAGTLDREALLALDAAYAAAPFPPPSQMIWRVDLAEAHWGTIPDPLAERTITQVAALGRIGDEWAVRIRWCRASPIEAIAAAACVTVPGVVQGAHLEGAASSAAP